MFSKILGSGDAQRLKEAKAFWTQAEKYFEGKLYNRALKATQDAITLAPEEYFQEAMDIMQVFSSQGNDEQAVSIGLALLKFDAKNYELMNKLGNALRNLKSFARAKKLYTVSLKLKPDFAEARYNLAACSFDITAADNTLMIQTRKVEAYNQFRRADFRGNRAGCFPLENQELEDDSKDAGKSKKKSEKGEASEEENEEVRLAEIQKITNQLKADLEKDPESWEAEFNLGLMYDLSDLVELSSQHYKKAMALAPNQIEPATNLAVSLASHEEQLDQAESILLELQS